MYKSGVTLPTNSFAMFIMTLVMMMMASSLVIGVNAADTETSTPETLTAKQIENIFLSYDVSDPLGDELDCQTDEIDEIICPSDSKIPCGDMAEIEAHCAHILGPAVVSRDLSTTATKNDNSNAYNGCIVYVSYHIFDNPHKACCQSDYCEKWIDKEQEELMNEMDESDFDDDYNYDDDDFDDDIIYDDDDDVFEDEEDGNDSSLPYPSPADNEDDDYYDDDDDNFDDDDDDLEEEEDGDYANGHGDEL